MADLQPTDQACCPWKKKSPLSWLVVVILWIGILGLISAAMSFFWPVLRSPESHRGVGQTLTLLELQPLTGDPTPLSTADLQGRVTLLNFWGPWCPPCRNELPHIVELQRHFAGQADFQVAAIAYPRGGGIEDPRPLRDETTELLKQMGLDLPTYYDPKDMTRAAVDRAIGFEGFPTNVLLDRRGVIRAVWVGYAPGMESQLERLVEKLLDETQPR